MSSCHLTLWKGLHVREKGGLPDPTAVGVQETRTVTSSDPLQSLSRPTFHPKVASTCYRGLLLKGGVLGRRPAHIGNGDRSVPGSPPLQRIAAFAACIVFVVLLSPDAPRYCSFRPCWSLGCWSGTTGGNCGKGIPTHSPSSVGLWRLPASPLTKHACQHHSFAYQCSTPWLSMEPPLARLTDC